MRKIYGLLFLMLGAFFTNAQNTANYTFTYSTSGSLEDLTSGATTFPTLLGFKDFGSTPITPLPFDFLFMGTRYSHFSANVDGQLRLHSIATGSAISGSITSYSSSATLALISGDNAVNDGVRYEVIGSAPNRKFVFEWTNFQVLYQPHLTNAGNMQLWLHESTGKIEYVYGEIYNAGSSQTTRAIFLSSGTSPGTSMYVIAGSTPVATSITTNTTFPVTNTFAGGSGTTTGSPVIADIGSTAEGSRWVYTFTPAVPASAPTNLIISSVQNTSMSLAWTAASPATNVLKYMIYFSTDGINYSYYNSTASTSYNATNLTAGTTYYWRIYSASEGVLSATSLDGSQATTAGATYTWNQTGSAAFITGSNWTPSRIPANTDILIIDGSITPNPVITGVSTQTIGQLVVKNNANAVLQSSAFSTLTISGGSDATHGDLDVEAGSTLNLGGSSSIGITFSAVTPTSTAAINGTLKTSTTSTGTLNFSNAMATVNGTLELGSGLVTTTSSSSSLSFSSGAICNIATNTLAIPLATWHPASTLNITGVTTAFNATNAGQTFGNVTYNCPGSNATALFFGTSTIAVVAGDLNVASTGTGKFRLLSNGALNVLGNLVVSGGSVEISSANGYANVAGNVSQTGGTIDITSGNGTATLRVGGNFNQASGSLVVSGTSKTDTLVFNGTSSQSFTLANAVTGAMGFRLDNPAGLSLNSNLDISSFAVISNGTISGTGSITYSGTLSKLIYNSASAAQTATPVEFPATGGPASLIIDNTATAPNNKVTIGFDRTLAGTSGILKLTSGILDNEGYTLTVPNGSDTAVSDGSATSYVKGALKRVFGPGLTGNANFTFPLGKSGYNPMRLINLKTGASGPEIVCEVFDANTGGTPDPGTMSALNTNRYWSATATTGDFTSALVLLSEQDAATFNNANAIGQSSTLNGLYAIAGGASTIVSGNTVQTTAPAVTNLGYFVLGTKNVPMNYVSSTTKQGPTTVVMAGDVHQEIIGIEVETSGNSSPLSITSFDLNTTGSSAPGTDISNAKLWYTGTSNSFATGTQFGTVTANPSGNFTVTGSQVLSEGTNYFWLTYDILPGATVNDIIDAECTSVTINSTPYAPSVTSPAGSRTIKGVLHGTYTVGLGNTYDFLYQALADLNTYGVSDSVIFELGALYFSGGETFPLVINPFNGASANNRLIIRPAPGVTATISGSEDDGLIRLNGADYVTIDGSNSHGTDRSLTIVNTGWVTPAAVALISNGTGAGATHNNIMNCNISTGGGFSTYGITISGSFVGLTGADNDNNCLRNNNITSVAYAISATGSTSTSTGGLDSLLIIGNTISTNITNGSSIGIEVGNALNSTISQNTISVNCTGSNVPVGIYLKSGFVSSQVDRNLITTAYTTSTNGYGGRGLVIGTGTTASDLTVSNNVIYGVNGASNNSGFGNSSMGIGIGVLGNTVPPATYTISTGGVRLYNNSVNLFGTHSYNANTKTTALYIASLASSLDIRNNIFANSLANTNVSAISPHNYAIYSEAASTAFTNIDYNIYHADGPQGITGYIGSDRADMAAIQAGFGGNTHSFMQNPNFISNTNPVPVTGAFPANYLTGIALPEVTTDFNGVVRSSVPDIGAYEGAEANRWIGATSASWSTGSNWDNGNVPSAGADIQISANSAHYPQLSGNTTVNNLFLQGNTASVATLSIDANKLTVTGTVSGTPDFMGSLTGSKNSMLEVSGNGTLSFTQTGDSVSNALSVLTISGGNTVLDNKVHIYEELNVSGGSLDMNGSNVVMKSSSRIAPVTGSISNATNVTVERYIPNKAAWRFLTPAVSTASSIYDNWQEGGAATSGYGTYITAPQGTGNGFDSGPNTTYSLYTWDPSLSSPWVHHNSTNGINDKLFAGTGYRLWVRSDRATPLGTGSDTRLRATGSPLVGTVTVKERNQAVSGNDKALLASGSGQFSLIGNPYWSPVSWTGVAGHANTQNIVNFYWAWDPNCAGGANGRGRYVTYDGTLNMTNVGSNSAVNHTIQPGQGIFVRNTPGVNGTTTLPQIEFQEADKTTGTTAVFKTTNSYAIARVSLYDDNDDFADAALVAFDQGFSNNVDAEDAVKMQNSSENLGIDRNNILLSIEKRSAIALSDTIPLRLSGINSALGYHFECELENMPAGVTAYLEDTVLGQVHTLNMNGTTTIPFSQSSTASMQHRFRIVFVEGTPLAATAIKVQARQQQEHVAVSWEVSNEQGIRKYEVERSVNGKDFNSKDAVTAKGSGHTGTSYNWLDKQPSAGANYYRIRSVDVNGAARYSETVVVNMHQEGSSVTIYPNPVKNGRIRVAAAGIREGDYTLRIYNAIGQVVYEHGYHHSGGSGIIEMDLGGRLSSGNYSLVLTGGDSTYTRSLIIDQQ